MMEPANDRKAETLQEQTQGQARQETKQERLARNVAQHDRRLKEITDAKKRREIKARRAA